MVGYLLIIFCKVITTSALLFAVVFIGVVPAFQRIIPFMLLTDFGNPVLRSLPNRGVTSFPSFKALVGVLDGVPLGIFCRSGYLLLRFVISQSFLLII